MGNWSVKIKWVSFNLIQIKRAGPPGIPPRKTSRKTSYFYAVAGVLVRIGQNEVGVLLFAYLRALPGERRDAPATTSAGERRRAFCEGSLGAPPLGGLRQNRVLRTRFYFPANSINMRASIDVEAASYRAAAFLRAINATPTSLEALAYGVPLPSAASASAYLAVLMRLATLPASV